MFQSVNGNMGMGERQRRMSAPSHDHSAVSGVAEEKYLYGCLHVCVSDVCLSMPQPIFYPYWTPAP